MKYNSSGIEVKCKILNKTGKIQFHVSVNISPLLAIPIPFLYVALASFQSINQSQRLFILSSNPSKLARNPII